MIKKNNKCIYAVHYNSLNTHIVEVSYYECIADDRIDLNTKRLSRQDVISEIKKGILFYTITKNANGKWEEGALVIIHLVHGIEYIKTVQDTSLRDNLDQLPRY